MARMSKMASSMSAAQFEQACTNFPRLSEKAKRVAFDVLVNGVSFAEIASTHKVERQLAHDWATKIYSAFVPEGWVSEVITLPPDLMEKTKALELEARAAWEDALSPARAVRP